MPTRLDLAYQAQVKALRKRVTDVATARFTAGQYRDADLERFVAEMVPLILAGRRQMSQLTDQWLATRLSASLGRKVKPLGPIDTDALRGVDAREVYARPFATVRTEVSRDKALDAAVAIASQRLRKTIESDMQLAKTHTARHVFSGTDGVTGFIRTLSGPKNCALCYVASTQRYHKGDLLPIHPGCDCGVEEITDRGEQVIAPERLRATHEAVEDRFGSSDSAARAPDYRKLILVEEHGELGPVLTVKGHHFTGPEAVKSGLDLTDLPRI